MGTISNRDESIFAIGRDKIPGTFFVNRGFTSAVVASPELLQSEVVDGLASLVAKSLVAAELDGRVARYGLLDTTRAYAIEKLGESGEGERLARRHAAAQTPGRRQIMMPAFPLSRSPM